MCWGIVPYEAPVDVVLCAEASVWNTCGRCVMCSGIGMKHLWTLCYVLRHRYEAPVDVVLCAQASVWSTCGNRRWRSTLKCWPCSKPTTLKLSSDVTSSTVLLSHGVWLQAVQLVIIAFGYDFLKRIQHCVVYQPFVLSLVIRYYALAPSDLCYHLDISIVIKVIQWDKRVFAR